MSNILYGYYFKSIEPSKCKSVKRIVPDEEMGNPLTEYHDFSVKCFESEFTDVNGDKWILIDGITHDIEGKKGET